MRIGKFASLFPGVDANHKLHAVWEDNGHDGVEFEVPAPWHVRGEPHERARAIPYAQGVGASLTTDGAGALDVGAAVLLGTGSEVERRCIALS